MIIHPTLKKKLDEKKKKYMKVSAFAELLPMFANRIIDNEYTGEYYNKFQDYYGKLPLAWGVNWYTNTPTNYPTETHKEVGFVNVYINTYSLFGSELSNYASLELSEAIREIRCHFFDYLNTTFYFLPDEAEAGLKRLEQWYVETKSKTDAELRRQRKAALERELESLND